MLHFAGYQPARSVHTQALHALRDGVARRAGSDLNITVTDSIVAAGHKASDLLRLVASGELDGCYFASSYLAATVPNLGVFDRPFEAGSRDAVFGGLDGETGATLARDMASTTPYRVLGWWDNGIRHISNAVRPIRAPADCVGLRLRTLDNEQHQAAFRRLGFVPTFIDVADLSRAVAEHTVDAQENPLTNVVNFGLHAHHGHVSLTGHLVGVAPLLMNHARHAALPVELQRVLAAASAASVVVQRQLALAEEASCRQILAEAGVAVLEPDSIDIEGLTAAVRAY
jgi:TRAP-type C4-dicarboxylate transport system substrate-binding protein